MVMPPARALRMLIEIEKVILSINRRIIVALLPLSGFSIIALEFVGMKLVKMKTVKEIIL